MLETQITVSGNVISEPIFKQVSNDQCLLKFRIAGNSRRLRPGTQEWEDGPSLYLTAVCWGYLAQQARRALVVGKPVIVTGCLRTNEYVNSDGQPRSTQEIKVSDIGLSIRRHEVRYCHDEELPQLSRDNYPLSHDDLGVSLDAA